MALSSLPLPRRRRGACTAGNPAALASDFADVLAHNAKLAAALLKERQRADHAEEELARVVDALGQDLDAARPVTA